MLKLGYCSEVGFTFRAGSLAKLHYIDVIGLEFRFQSFHLVFGYKERIMESIKFSM